MKAANQSITIVAPARLHMGFFDLHGGLGRQFGGLGLALADIATSLRFRPAARLSCHGAHAERVEQCANTLLHSLGLTGGVHIEVLTAIPAHIGLGSGTQLALAVAAGIAELFSLSNDLRSLACMLQRGVRSGIGLGAFMRGGFVVDGGRGTNTVVPPVIAQMPFPSAWRLVLIFDRSTEGLSGASEVSAFQRLAQMSATDAAHLCRLVLMQILPALAEHDYVVFGAGITAVQAMVGDHFAQCQGGRYASADVANALSWFKEHGVSGVGQSSWGPTGFAVLPDQARAEQLVAAAREHWPDSLDFHICRANNDGAEIHRDEIDSHSDHLRWSRA